MHVCLNIVTEPEEVPAVEKRERRVTQEAHKPLRGAP